MRCFGLYLLVILVISTIWGCQSSVWQSDICQRIDTQSGNTLGNIQFPKVESILTEDIKQFQLSEQLYDYSVYDNDKNRLIVNDEVGMPEKTSVTSALPTRRKKESAPTDTLEKPMDCIDINRAESAQLMSLPGIGKNRAEAVVAMRNKRPFKRKKDITRIKGISSKSYKKIERFICDI